MIDSFTALERTTGLAAWLTMTASQVTQGSDVGSYMALASGLVASGPLGNRTEVLDYMVLANAAEQMALHGVTQIRSASPALFKVASLAVEAAYAMTGIEEFKASIKEAMHPSVDSLDAARLGVAHRILTHTNHWAWTVLAGYGMRVTRQTHPEAVSAVEEVLAGRPEWLRAQAVYGVSVFVDLGPSITEMLTE